MSSEAHLENLFRDESSITEITIQPDGRLYVFGTSRQVLEVLEGLGPTDVRLGELLRHVRAIETATAVMGSVTVQGGDPSAT